jgi:hypothetical protein
MLTVSTVLSQENLKKEKIDSNCYSYQDTKIIAQTFNQNNYLQQRVDTLESLQKVYQSDIFLYKEKDSLLNYKINLTDDVVVTQSATINKLSNSYNTLLKDNKKSKIYSGVLIGGLTVSLATTLYLIFKP